MEFKLTPLSEFIRSSNTAPLSGKEYSALAHPEKTLPAQTPQDSVSLSTDSGRQSFINSITTNFGGGGNPLFNSLTPSGNGLGGLYAGVGQLASYQMKSLIDGYV
ncbi:hypothetical protein MNBD_NITROSPINAE01-9 [hydrothermal vent metagenome]|uniref:Uncharacterized protein n=1 Tax=hydrothermal vent metagenome TaxID=652676 RepID=A0A3B1C4I2_9ZZZZ